MDLYEFTLAEVHRTVAARAEKAEQTQHQALLKLADKLGMSVAETTLGVTVTGAGRTIHAGGWHEALQLLKTSAMDSCTTESHRDFMRSRVFMPPELPPNSL